MNGQLPQAVLLDLDDTILDDSGNVSECWRLACQDCQSDVVDPHALYQEVERTRDWFWGDPARNREGRLDLGAARREVVRISLERLGFDAPALAAKIAERYRYRRDLGIRPIAGAIETVQWIRDHGCRLALLTNGNGDTQRGKILRFRLDQLFDAVLIEGELGYGKPDPRIYRLAFKELGALPSEIWMAGDNLEYDVAAPQQMGVYGIWIDLRGIGPPPEARVRPDRTIRRLADLRERAPNE